jgi:hypothetical protein
MRELFQHRWAYSYFAALWEMTTLRQRVIFCQHCDGVTPATDRACEGCGAELFDPLPCEPCRILSVSGRTFDVRQQQHAWSSPAARMLQARTPGRRTRQDGDSGTRWPGSVVAGYWDCILVETAADNVAGIARHQLDCWSTGRRRRIWCHLEAETYWLSAQCIRHARQAHLRTDTGIASRTLPILLGGSHTCLNSGRGSVHQLRLVSGGHWPYLMRSTA